MVLLSLKFVCTFTTLFLTMIDNLEKAAGSRLRWHNIQTTFRQNRWVSSKFDIETNIDKMAMPQPFLRKGKWAKYLLLGWYLLVEQKWIALEFDMSNKNKICLLIGQTYTNWSNEFSTVSWQEIRNFGIDIPLKIRDWKVLRNVGKPA